jgi:hypothetical protein
MKFHVDMKNTYTWIISIDLFVKVCVEMEKPRVQPKMGCETSVQVRSSMLFSQVGIPSKGDRPFSIDSL